MVFPINGFAEEIIAGGRTVFPDVFGDWARMLAFPQRDGESNGVGSAAVPGRINLMADRASVSIKQILRPNFDRLGAAKNGLAPEWRSMNA